MLYMYIRILENNIYIAYGIKHNIVKLNAPLCNKKLYSVRTYLHSCSICVVLQKHFGLLDSRFVSSMRRRVEMIVRGFAGEHYDRCVLPNLYKNSSINHGGYHRK